MIIREATRSDVSGLVAVRGAVRANILTSDISQERIVAGLEVRGKGWVAEHERQVVGFSMADREEPMIWALFLLPEWEKRAWAEHYWSGPWAGCGVKGASASG